MRNNKAAGISLVALVITIIVLIILTGAVIVTFMEGGIIDRAKESVFKNDMRTYQEILALKRAENQMEIALGEKEDVEINASSLEEIQAIIPEFKEEYEGLVIITRGELSIGERVSGDELSSSEELYATWLDDLGIGLSRMPKNALALAEGLEVGDYVAYIPDGTIPTELPISLTRKDINWRVLKNDGRQVTLISETPIDSITLAYADGWINGPSILDETCAGLYSGSKGIARNLNIEDVNEILKGDRAWGDDETNWEYMGTDYGNHNVPEGVRTIEELETCGEEFVGTIGSYYRNSPEEGKELGEYAPKNYSYTKDSLTNATDKEKELIFETDGYGYWLSSNFVSVEFGDEYLVRFCMCRVVANSVCGYYIADSGNGGSEGELPIRPIVILNADVEVSNPSAGGDAPDTAWQLK